MNLVRAVWLALVALGAAGGLAFVVLYGWGSRGWHRTAVGRNLMAMGAALTVLLGLSLASWLVRLPPALWLGGMGALDLVLWWRVVILWRIQRSRP